jgi:hypothetical protein
MLVAVVLEPQPKETQAEQVDLEIMVPIYLATVAAVAVLVQRHQVAMVATVELGQVIVLLMQAVEQAQPITVAVELEALAVVVMAVVGLIQVGLTAQSI